MAGRPPRSAVQLLWLQPRQVRRSIDALLMADQSRWPTTAPHLAAAARGEAYPAALDRRRYAAARGWRNELSSLCHTRRPVGKGGQAGADIENDMEN